MGITWGFENEKIAKKYKSYLHPTDLQSKPDISCGLDLPLACCIKTCIKIHFRTSLQIDVDDVMTE